MTLVVYDGPTDKTDLSTEYHVDDETGKIHRLYKGSVADVPEGLGKALLTPSKDREERLRGHKFREPSKEEREAFERRSKRGGSSTASAPPAEPTPPAGPGGTENATVGAGGTATAGVRTGGGAAT